MLIGLQPDKPNGNQNQLKERYEQLRSVLDDMISGVILLDNHGIVLLMNKIVLRYLGRPESDCIGQSIHTMFPDTADMIMRRVHAVFETRRSKTYETKIKRPKLTLHLIAVYQPVYDTNKTIFAVQILLLDVTQQRRAQHDLVNTKRLLDKSQRIARIGSWEWRLRDDKITLSDGLLRIYGFEPGETVSVNDMVDNIHPDDRARWDKELTLSFEDQRPFNLDYRIIRKDGTIAWITSQSDILSNSKGQPSKIWGVVQDITERMEAERKRIELENRLRQSQKMEAIGTLAGGIAHDFNNILSSIIGFTELAMDDIPPDTLTYENLAEVLQAGLRAKDLVHHILTFSRQRDLQTQPIQISSIVKETARMLRATIPATINIQVDDQSEKSTIMGDASQIHQVILNLCTNAAHAMENEGGLLTIRLENFSTAKGSDGLTFEGVSGACIKASVIDTGTGIAPELIERIFEPYMTTKESGKGTGLGLSVVHGIIKAHNGAICVKSRLGRGTTMEIALPLAEKQTSLQPPLNPSVSSGNEHVLLIDDEAQIVNSHKQSLQRLGYTVTAHTNSIEAMQSFLSQPDQFDAVITDMTMPDMTGDQLARRIKSTHPQIPVIICTGYSEKLTDNTIKSAGIELCLMKPVSRNDFANALRKVLDARKKK